MCIRWRLDWLILFLLLAVSIVIVYHYYLLPPYFPKNFGAVDVYTLFGPFAYLLDTALHEGHFPLWNPLSYCGQPFAANPQTSLFYPPQLLRSVLTLEPTPWATAISLQILVGFHILLAGMATIAFARSYGLSRSASFTAAVVYVFGPHSMLRVMEHWTLFAITAWLPLVLLLARRAMEADQGRDRVRYMLLGALAFSMCILAGFPQVTYYSALALGLFCGLHVLAHVEWKVRGRFRRLFRRSFSTLIILGVLVFVSSLIAAAFLLPAAEFAGLSSRISGSGLRVGSPPQDLNPVHLLQNLAIFTGAKDNCQGWRAAGIASLLLGMAAFGHRRRRDVFVFCAFCIIMNDLVIGPPMPFGRLLAMVDVFNFGSPWRSNIAASLPFSLLVGFGLDAATERIKTISGTALRTFLYLLIGALALKAVMDWRTDHPFLQTSLAVVILPAITLGILLLATPLNRPAFLRPVIALLVFAEIAAWAYYYVPVYINQRMPRSTIAGTGELPVFWKDNIRGTVPRANTNCWTLSPAINGYDAVYIHDVRQALCTPGRERNYYRVLHTWEVQVDNQRGNLFLKRAFWLARDFVRGPLPPKHALFPSSTTVYLPDPPPELPIPEVPRAKVPARAVSEDVERVLVAEEAQLKQKPATQKTKRKESLALPTINVGNIHSALELTYTTTSQVDLNIQCYEPSTKRREDGFRNRLKPTRGQEAKVQIALPDFMDLQATLQWEAPPNTLQLIRAELLKDRADENNLIHIISRSFDEVELLIDKLPAPRILTFLDSHYPGWKAYADGQPAPIFKANDAFKAIALPAGAHHVIFRFEPVRVYAGLGISLISTGVVLIALLFLRQKPQNDISTSEEPPLPIFSDNSRGGEHNIEPAEEPFPPVISPDEIFPNSQETDGQDSLNR